MFLILISPLLRSIITSKFMAKSRPRLNRSQSSTRFSTTRKQIQTFRSPILRTVIGVTRLRRWLLDRRLQILGSCLSGPPCWNPSFPMSLLALHWLMLLCLGVLSLRSSFLRCLADVQSLRLHIQRVPHFVPSWHHDQLYGASAPLDPNKSAYLVIVCRDIGLGINTNPIHV